MLKDFNIEILEGEEIPEMLREISDAPEKIYLQGNPIQKYFVLLVLVNTLNMEKMYVKNSSRDFEDTIYV